MALLVADLVGVMRIDDSQYHAALDRGESRWSGAAAAVGRGVAFVGSAAGSALVLAGGVGVKTAAQLEQAEIAFTTMLGSGERARAFLGELQEFARSTPFELPQLQRAASSLVSVGVEARRVIPLMTVLGDSTSAMGTGSEGIERASRALQQMSIKGKVSAEEMLQLAEAGVPAWEALAVSLGVTTGKAMKLVENGKVSADQLYTALETRAGATMQNVSGMMAVQSQSLTGMGSALKDTVSVGLAAAVQPLIPLLKDGLGAATAFAAEQAPRLASGLQALVTWVTNLVTQLRAGDLSSLPEPLRQLVGVVQGMSSGNSGEMSASLGDIRDAASQLVPAVQQLAAELPSLNDILSVSATVFGFLADHADLLDDVLPYVVAALVLYRTAQAIGNVVALASLPIQAAQVASNFRLAAALRATSASASTSAATQVAASGAVQASTMRTAAVAVAAQLRMVAGWVASGAAAVGSAAMTAGAWVATQVRTVAALAVMAAGFVAQGAVMVATAAATAAGVVAGWVMMGVQSMLQAGRMALAWVIAMGPVGWVIAAVIALVALIVANWDTVWSTTKQVWEWIWTRAIKPAIDFIVGYVQWWVGNVLAAVNFLRELPGRVGGFFLSMHYAIVEKAGQAIEWVRGLPGRLMDAVGNLGTLLVDKGRAAVEGLWSGIQGAGGWIKNKITGFIADIIPGPVRKALGISSPSRVMAELGRWSGVGLAEGLLGTRGLVARAARQVAAEVDGPDRMGTSPGGYANLGRAAGGLYVENLNVKAYSDRFSLRQVQEDLYYGGVA